MSSAPLVAGSALNARARSARWVRCHDSLFARIKIFNAELGPTVLAPTEEDALTDGREIDVVGLAERATNDDRRHLGLAFSEHLSAPLVSDGLDLTRIECHL